MAHNVGLSGWDSQFIFEHLSSSKDKLAAYAQTFSTVEVNSTFYHTPRQTTVEGWLERTPETFLFSIKMNKLFSHTERLHLTAEGCDKLAEFVAHTALLKGRLAWYLLQLPPSLAYDATGLTGFLSQLRDLANKEGVQPKIAVEFRHLSWYKEDNSGLLEPYGAFQVISNSPGKWPTLWLENDETHYIRLHGNRKMWYSEYSDEELDKVLEFLNKSKAKESWIYFDNTATAAARNNSIALMKKLGLNPNYEEQLELDDLFPEEFK